VTRRPYTRAGYTILELMVVITIVLILGAIVGPSLLGMWGNNRTKAGVDTVTARLADARGAAIAQGIPYRVAASPDGTQVRIDPDESEPTEQLASEQPSTPIRQVDKLPPGVTLTPMTVGTTQADSADGWITLVVFLPDGTCRDDASEFTLSEKDQTPQVVRVRGLTGVWTVNPATATNPTAATGVSP